MDSFAVCTELGGGGHNCNDNVTNGDKRVDVFADLDLR